MKTPISVYIPSYNVEKFIGLCIEHLLAQTYSPDEILVINDGSTDKTIEIAQKYPVKIIHHEKNMGLSCARNTGIQNSKNQWVASIDADCMAHPDWLKKLSHHLDTPNTGGIGGKLVEHFSNKITDRWRAVHMRQHWWDQQQVNPMFLFGHSNIFNKEAIQKAGGYNPKYRTNYEDVDICNKIRQTGYNLIYEPTAVVEHYRRDTIYTDLKAYWQWTLFDKVEPSTIKSLLVKWKFNLGKSIQFIKSDYHEGHKDLIGINLLLIPYHSYVDCKNWKN